MREYTTVTINDPKYLKNTATSTIDYDIWWLFRYYRNAEEANSDTKTINDN